MQSARRLLAVLLLLAFGLGAPLLSAEAAEMAQHTVIGTTDGQAPMDCDSCPSGDMAMSASCSGVCTGGQAPGVASTEALGIDGAAFNSLPDRTFTGSVSSPEPYPPKLTILS